MKLYVAGPISGVDNPFPVFREAAAKLREAGYEVVDPSTFDDNLGKSWADCMKRDLPELLKCDGVALLPNWTESRGASLEYLVATDLGMPTHGVPEWLVRAGALPQL